MSEERNNQEEKAIHYESGLPIFAPPPKDEDAEKRAEHKATRTYEDRQISIQSGIFWTQIGLVAFGLIGIGVSVWQASISQQSADTSDKSVLLAQKSERDSRKASEAQARQSGKILDATIENFRLDQRAWVGISGVKTTDAPEVGKVYVIDVDFKNTGKTPAYDVKVFIHAGTLDSDGGKGPWDRSQKATSYGLIQPNGGMFTSISPIGDPKTGVVLPMSQPLWDQLHSGKITMYVAGWLTYDDVFGGSHWTEVCYKVLPNLGAFSGCSKHNDADSEKTKKR